MTQLSPGTGIFRMWATVSSPDEARRAIILWAMRLGVHSHADWADGHKSGHHAKETDVRHRMAFFDRKIHLSNLRRLK
jgi:hypothetical protein